MDKYRVFVIESPDESGVQSWYTFDLAPQVGPLVEIELILLPQLPIDPDHSPETG